MAAVACVSGFLADRRGNFAILFAICLIPVLALAGAAVDYSRIRSAEAGLQDAADSAALAAATSGRTDAQRQQVAEDFVHANAPDLDATVKTTINTHDLVVEVSTRLPLPVLSAFGMAETVIAVTAQVESVAPFSGSTTVMVGDGFKHRQVGLAIQNARARRGGAIRLSR